jgi:SAM-dependent methyltransferase
VTDARQPPVPAPLGGRGDAGSSGHARGEGLDQMLRWGRARSAARVLDIATGVGDTALALSRFTPTVVATDLTLATLGAARNFIAGQGGAGVYFSAADVEALPFRDETFGVVTCRTAAHRFLELLPALRQVARVLRRGGSFLVEDTLGHDDAEMAAFILEVERRLDPSHVRSFRQIEWTAFLRAVGLTVIDEAIMDERRPWEDWTGRIRMSPEARAGLDRFVLAAPARYREAFRFKLDGEHVVSFTDRMLLLRADKD